MKGGAGVIFLLLIGLGALIAVTSPKGRDAIDVALGRKRAV